MIDNFELTQRHMLPRWRLLQSSMQLGELNSVSSGRKFLTGQGLLENARSIVAGDFLRHKRAWDETEDLYFAEELLCSAVMLGKHLDSSVATAARAIRTSVTAQDAIRRFAAQIIGGNDRTADVDAEPVQAGAALFSEINLRKQLLSVNPRDGLRVAETALLYATLGQLRKSRRLINHALMLLPDDRYVLRAAARFFSHIGEPDTAKEWLLRSARTDQDPWLASAQMAVCAVAGETPRRWKIVTRMLNDTGFSDRDKSELSAQAGTIEMLDGSRNRALRFLKLSAKDPTENSVAQIEWLGRKEMAFEPEDLLADFSISHEAVAHTAYWKCRWEGALESCKRWQNIESFSVRPAIFGSFVAAVSSSQLDRGAEIAQVGLASNPNDVELLNNLAVILAYQNRIDDARSTLARTSRHAKRDDAVVLNATRGLVDFRSGDIDAGIRNYSEAIEMAIQKKDYITGLRAYCYLGREIVRVHADLGGIITSRIDSFCSRLKRRNYRIPQDVIVIREQIGSHTMVSRTLVTRASKEIDVPPFSPDTIQ